MCTESSTPTSAGDNVTVNGIGATFYGARDACKTCGSTTSSQWICVLFIPIFPLGRYRVKYVTPNRYLSRKLPGKAKAPPNAAAPQNWERVAENLSKTGWTWGCTSRIDSKGQTSFVADAHRGDGKRFVVRADDRLAAFLELERQARADSALCPQLAPVISSAEIPASQSNPPSKRPNIADILGITFCVAFVLFVAAYAWQSGDFLRSPLTPKNTKSLQASQSAPEIRKAIPVPQAGSSPDGFAAYAADQVEDQTLQFEPLSPGLTSTPVNQHAEITYRVANIKPSDVLNVRAGAGSNYPVITAISPETRGITLSDKRTANGDTMWQEISVNGYTGWVNEIYLEAEQ